MSQKIIFSKVIAGCDFGWSNPMACVIAGLDSDDRLYVIDEFYLKNCLIDQFVEICKGFKEKYGVSRFLCDPSEPGYIRQMRNAGLNAIGAKNDVLAGINLVATRIDIKKDGRPRLFINSKCVNTLMEFENYRYPDVGEEKPVQENPVKIFDHSMDCIRMMVLDLEGGFKIVYLSDPEGILI